MKDLKKIFPKLLPGKIKLIETALENVEVEFTESVEKIRKILHSFKNTAGIYGYNKLEQKAIELDELDDEEMLNNLDSFLSTLKNISSAEKQDRTHILLIEDDDFVIQLVNAILPSEEYKIITVQTGERAKEILAEEKISLVISNIILTDLDARELLSEFEGKYNIPSIVITDEDSEKLAAQSIEIGAEYYFTLPFNINDFKNKVFSLVGGSGFTGYENINSNIFSRVRRKYDLLEDYKQLQNSKSDDFEYTFAIVEVDLPEDQEFSSFERDEFIYKYILKLKEVFGDNVYIAHWERLKIGMIFQEVAEDEVIDHLKDFRKRVEQEGLHFENYSDVSIPFIAGGKQFNIDMELKDAFIQVDEIVNRAEKSEADKVLCSKCSMTEKEILLAEEDEIISSLIIHRLGKLNYKVTHIENGNDVIPRLNKDRAISALITTVNLPEMGGFEIVEKLRKSRVHRNLPIIILTPYGREHDILHALDIGVDDYLVKPFSPNELIARIQRLTK